MLASQPRANIAKVFQSRGNTEPDSCCSLQQAMPFLASLFQKKMLRFSFSAGNIINERPPVTAGPSAMVEQ